MDIRVEQLSEEEIERRDIRNWPTWEAAPSRFDWYYDETEECLILQGRVKVETDDGEIEIKEGDFVTFPKGLSCVWEITEPVKKHYNFR